MSIKVNNKGGVYIDGHGQYNLGDSSTEDRVLKLALLKELCEHAMNDLAESGEILTPHADKLESLANDMFSGYSHYIEHGCDIFSCIWWHRASGLRRYNSRHMACGFMNATDEESVNYYEHNPPKGWWLDESPTRLSKAFNNFGILVIDYDTEIRIGCYRHALDMPDKSVWLYTASNAAIFIKMPECMQEEVARAMGWLHWYINA